MKKITSVFLVGLLMLFSFVSCNKKNNTIVIYSCAEDYRNEYYLAEFNTPKAKIDLGNELNNYLSEAGYENLDGFLSDYKYAQSAIEVKTNNPGYTMAEMAMSDPEFKKIVSEWKGDINFQEWHNINYLTDEQKKVLIYFLSKGNGDTTLANNYLNAIGSELAYKEGKEIAEK